MPLLLATVESSTSSVPAVIRVLPLNVLLHGERERRVAVGQK